VTVAVRPDAARRGERYPVTARVSHPDEAAVTAVVTTLREALAARGVRSRRLGGRQGPALLDTTLLASTH